MGYTDTTLLLPLSQQQQPPHNNETSSLLNNSQTDDIKILSPIVNRQQIKGQQVVIVDSSIYGSFSSSTDSDVEQRTSIVSCYNQKNGLCLHSNNDNIVVADHDDDYGDDTKQCHNGTMVSGKTIGMIGSLSIAINSLAGPAILQLPFQYQQSGFIPTTLCLICVAILSAFCSLHMANTISKIKDNSNYDLCIEFSDPFRYYWNEYAYKGTQILFFFTSICLNVAAIVDTAEVVDSVIGLHYKTYGLSIDHGFQLKSWNVIDHHNDKYSDIDYSNSSSIMNVTTHYDQQKHSCTRKEVKLGLCDPFNDIEEYGSFILTAGYIVTAMVFLPICLKDLKENTSWQILGSIILVTLSGYFCYTFASVLSFENVIHGHNVTLWGSMWSDMLGIIMFNFALVLAIPAWLHEKKSNVSVHATIVQSTCISTILYIAVGVLGALAIPHVNVNMLSPMVSGAYGPGIQIASSFFAFFIIGLDIPLFCVLTRYNLTHSGLCSVNTANILVVYIPWCISWLFYQGDSIGVLLSWGGVLLTSAAAFILPLYLSLRALNIDPIYHLGTVPVYGKYITSFMTWKNHERVIQILLLIAIGSVICAIIGQIVSDEEKEQYVHSDVYIDSAETIVKNSVKSLKIMISSMDWNVINHLLPNERRDEGIP